MFLDACLILAWKTDSWEQKKDKYIQQQAKDNQPSPIPKEDVPYHHWNTEPQIP